MAIIFFQRNRGKTIENNMKINNNNNIYNDNKLHA